MRNIFFSNFKSVYSLESFLIEINCKLTSQQEKDELKLILKHLATIIITFDFDFKGPFKSYIDRRYTFEQLLLLCYVKVNESKHKFDNHMFITRPRQQAYSTQAGSSGLSTKQLELTQAELRNRLMALENLSICYFLNRTDGDGIWWRRLHTLVGSSIIKYLLLYSYLFRRINDRQNTHIQICGVRLNSIYKKLIAQKLQADEKAQTNSKTKAKLNRTTILQEVQLERNVVGSSSGHDMNHEFGKKARKSMRTLKHIFDEYDHKLAEGFSEKKTAAYQLKMLGHENLNKTTMLYSRNLGMNISINFIYSNKALTASTDTAMRIIREFIFKDLAFDLYPHDRSDLIAMRNQLAILIGDFIAKYRTCPFNVFLACFCGRKQRTTNEQDSTTSRKRKRQDTSKESKAMTDKGEEASLKDHVKAKQVFAFVRRCLIHTLDVKIKAERQQVKRQARKYEADCPLLGGKTNFNCLTRKLYSVIAGLKYDTITLNHFLHGIKFARIKFLQSVKCDQFKRLILLALLRWLLEDFTFMLVKAQFFATDTSKTNSEVFFYLKSDWKRIVQKQLSDPSTAPYRRMYNLEKIKESDAIGYCNRYESNGIYLGRLFPKNVNNECRIISGCRVVNPCNKKSFNSNYRYITLNNALKWLITNDRNLIGFACCGHRDIQKRYMSFLSLNTMSRSFSQTDSLASQAQPFKKWNFMKIDIQKCFDSIDTKELIEYVNGLFAERLGYDVFTLLRYCSLSLDIDHKQLRARYDNFTLKHSYHEKGFLYGISDLIAILESNAANIREQQQTASRSTAFKSTMSENTGSMEKMDHVIVPLSIHDRNVTLRKLKDSLTKCLEHVLIKIHNDIYERMNGILQGSICSRNLCDLYLGKLENELFYQADGVSQQIDSVFELNARMKLVRANEIILRVVDDYLLIGTELARLQEICKLLKTKVKVNENKSETHEWTQCQRHDNETKTTSNATATLEQLEMDKEGMEMDISSTSDCGLSVSDRSESINFLANWSGKYFSWCGFDFDLYTLDIYFNYEKYFDSSNLKNRLNTTSNYKNAFAQFNLKFLRLFNGSSSKLVIDSRINNLQAILRNFVDFFALSAVRFCLYTRVMPSQLLNNHKLQMRLVLNQCFLCEHKLNFNLRQLLQQYFYSTFNLFKYICLRVYSILVPRYNLVKRHFHLLALTNKYLRKLNFITLIRTHKALYFDQFNLLIDQQLAKFFHVKL